MSKRQTLILLGIWIMALLFLGFPPGWDKVLALITGLLIAVTAYSLKPEKRSSARQEVPFVEHKSEPVSPKPPQPLQPEGSMEMPSRSSSSVPLTSSTSESVTNPNPIES